MNSFDYKHMFEMVLQIEFPKSELVLAHHDDTAVYDDSGKGQHDFKDDPRLLFNFCCYFFFNFNDMFLQS